MYKRQVIRQNEECQYEAEKHKDDKKKKADGKHKKRKNDKNASFGNGRTTKKEESKQEPEDRKVTQVTSINN